MLRVFAKPRRQLQASEFLATHQAREGEHRSSGARAEAGTSAGLTRSTHVDRRHVISDDEAEYARHGAGGRQEEHAVQVQLHAEAG